jgi:hypothetical protein
MSEPVAWVASAGLRDGETFPEGGEHVRVSTLEKETRSCR